MLSSLQSFYQALVICTIITLSISRPQNSIENQDVSAENQQPAMSEMQKLYSPYRYPVANNYIGVDETAPIDRLQMQVLRNPYYSGGANVANGLSSSGSSAAYWDPMYRIPEMKRQVRYRQCYFNPISCFKK